MALWKPEFYQPLKARVQGPVRNDMYSQQMTYVKKSANDKIDSKLHPKTASWRGKDPATLLRTNRCIHAGSRKRIPRQTNPKWKCFLEQKFFMPH